MTPTPLSDAQKAAAAILLLFALSIGVLVAIVIRVARFGW